MYLYYVDWGLNSNVWDVIYRSKDKGKEVLKYTLKRCGDSNSVIASHALTLLQSCVSNCGPSFHAHVSTKDTMKTLAKIGTSKKAVRTDIG